MTNSTKKTCIQNFVFANFYIIRTEDKIEKFKQNSTSLMLRPCSPGKLVIFGIKAKVNKHVIAKSTMLSFSLDSMASYLYTSSIPL